MNESIKDLAKYRLDKALEELKNSEAMIKSKSYSKFLNCSYYAIFHVTRALLAFDKFDSRKHSGIISYFIKKYHYCLVVYYFMKNALYLVENERKFCTLISNR